ncbi:MAG: energy transducer TonB [Betaproteobacteria bacterium]|nr:energy transducer TonB [Betaproteobacteria bacterium]
MPAPRPGPGPAAAPAPAGSPAATVGVTAGNMVIAPRKTTPEADDRSAERAAAEDSRAAQAYRLKMLREFQRHMANKNYPLAARQRGEEGAVMLVFEFKRDGKLAGIAIKRTSGFKALDDHALAQAKTFRFPPVDDRLRKRSNLLIELQVDYTLREE